MSHTGFISECVLQASSLDKFLFAELTSDVPPGEKRLKYRDLASLPVLLFLVVSSFLICQLQTYKYIKQWDNIRQTDWWDQLSPLIIFPGRMRCEGFAVQIISGGQLEHFDWLLKCNYKDRKNSSVWWCCSYLSNQTLFFKPFISSYFYKYHKWHCYILKGWILS